MFRGRYRLSAGKAQGKKGLYDVWGVKNADWIAAVDFPKAHADFKTMKTKKAKLGGDE
jgi:hypothetical protein